MLIQCIDYKDPLLQLNMLPLTMRLKYEDIVFLWKCLHGMYDINVHDFVKFSSDINHVTLRKSITLCRTDCFQRSLFNRVVQI